MGNKRGGSVMENPEVKPCPFCQHVGIVIREGSTSRWLVAECSRCGARCEEVRAWTCVEGTPDEWRAAAEKGEKAAIAAWNTRSEAT